MPKFEWKSGQSPHFGPVLVPVAFINVPNLLGRLGILEWFKFIFDPKRRRTEVRGPLHYRGKP